MTVRKTPAKPRKNAPKTVQPAKPRGKPFASDDPRRSRFAKGNPGRPKGARNKTTIAVEALFEGEGERLTRRCIRAAMAGDMTAMRIAMDRIAPPRRDRFVEFELPQLQTPHDAVAGVASVVKAIATGKITPSEGDHITGLLAGFCQIAASATTEERLKALEDAVHARD